MDSSDAVNAGHQKSLILPDVPIDAEEVSFLALEEDQPMLHVATHPGQRCYEGTKDGAVIQISQVSSSPIINVFNYLEVPNGYSLRWVLQQHLVQKINNNETF